MSGVAVDPPPGPAGGQPEGGVPGPGGGAHQGGHEGADGGHRLSNCQVGGSSHTHTHTHDAQAIRTAPAWF